MMRKAVMPMTWYERVIAAHTSVTSAASHGQRLKSSRYFVWAEDGANDRAANGRHAMRSMSGHTDLFTKKEFDPWVDKLGEAFSDFDIAWELISADYEEETGFWHYSWDWEAPVSG